MFSDLVTFVVIAMIGTVATAVVNSQIKDSSTKVIVTFLLLVSMMALSGAIFHGWGKRAGMEISKEIHAGQSISLTTGNYEGKTLRPVAVVVNGEEILLIDTDRRLYYSLLGTVLEKGLSTTNMVGNELILYHKGGAMYIGMKEPQTHPVPTGSEASIHK